MSQLLELPLLSTSQLAACQRIKVKRIIIIKFKSKEKAERVLSNVSKIELVIGVCVSGCRNQTFLINSFQLKSWKPFLGLSSAAKPKTEPPTMTTTTTMTAATTTTTATTMTSTATVTAFEGFHNFVGPLLQMTKIAQTIFNLHDGLNCSVMIGTSQNRRKAREEKKLFSYRSL